MKEQEKVSIQISVTMDEYLKLMKMRGSLKTPWKDFFFSVFEKAGMEI